MSQNIVFKKDNVEYMKLCLDVTLYWLGSVFNHAEGVLNFYRRALEVIGDELKFYATEQMPNAKPISPESLNILPAWMAQADKSKEIFTLNLEGNSLPDLPSDTALDFWAVEYPEDPAGMIRLILPIDFIQKTSLSKFIDLVKKLCGDMKFHSGHGGYAINWDHKGSYAFPSRKEMAFLSKRYPGIELPEVATTIMAIPHGIKRVNWLTLVGSVLIENTKIRNSLVNGPPDNEIVVNRLSGGILIVAGREPKVGDVNRQEDLGPYHMVGKALAKIRSREHPPFLVNKKGFASDEITEAWLSFFDE